MHDDAPSSWVVRFAPLIVTGGPVLDVACGRGRHARWLEARGHRVIGIDRDADALAASGATGTVVADLEAAPWPLAERRFAAVVVHQLFCIARCFRHCSTRSRPTAC